MAKIDFELVSTMVPKGFLNYQQYGNHNLPHQPQTTTSLCICYIVVYLFLIYMANLRDYFLST